MVYGCDQYGLFWKGEYATLLSRTEWLDGRFTGKAKQALSDLDYDYNTNWMDPGSTCGFQAAPTYDELMISVFEHEPLWEDYQRFHDNTINTRGLYRKLFSNFPSGFIT